MTGTFGQARRKCLEENKKYKNVLPIDVPVPRDQGELESLAQDGLFCRDVDGSSFCEDEAWIDIRLV